jgi:acylphosphatase
MASKKLITMLVRIKSKETCNGDFILLHHKELQAIRWPLQHQGKQKMIHGRIRNAGDHRNSIPVTQTTNKVRGVTRWVGGCQAAAPTTHKFKFKKKNRFCRHDDIKHLV